MFEYLDGEMSEMAIKQRFSTLLKNAAYAFSIDSSYTTDIVLKAKAIQARKAKTLAAA